MKIKFNWGTGIVIAIVSFIFFIMYMVTQMISNPKYNYDFVTDKYYEKELEYQNDINAIDNVSNLKEPIRIERVIGKGLRIILPKEFDRREVKGKINLYRPSNKKLDFELSILDDSDLIIPEDKLIEGRWNIDVKFTYKGKKYLYQEKLTL